MTFRVIEGGGSLTASSPGSLEEARELIIDRVAEAIWAFQDEIIDPAMATWSEMKELAARDAGRPAQHVRETLAQARGAISALHPAGGVISPAGQAAWALLFEAGRDAADTGSSDWPPASTEDVEDVWTGIIEALK
jgi:hypothetical protein